MEETDQQPKDSVAAVEEIDQDQKACATKVEETVQGREESVAAVGETVPNQYDDSLFPHAAELAASPPLTNAEKCLEQGSVGKDTTSQSPPIHSGRDDQSDPKTNT